MNAKDIFRLVGNKRDADVENGVVQWLIKEFESLLPEEIIIVLKTYP